MHTGLQITAHPPPVWQNHMYRQSPAVAKLKGDSGASTDAGS